MQLSDLWIIECHKKDNRMFWMTEISVSYLLRAPNISDSRAEALFSPIADGMLLIEIMGAPKEISDKLELFIFIDDFPGRLLLICTIDCSTSRNSSSKRPLNANALALMRESHRWHCDVDVSLLFSIFRTMRNNARRLMSPNQLSSWYWYFSSVSASRVSSKSLSISLVSWPIAEQHLRNWKRAEQSSRFRL